MIHNAKTLYADEKAVIETLLGRRVLDDEEISARVIQPPPLSAERRAEIVSDRNAHFRKFTSSANRCRSMKATRSLMRRFGPPVRICVSDGAGGGGRSSKAKIISVTYGFQVAGIAVSAMAAAARDPIWPDGILEWSDDTTILAVAFIGASTIFGGLTKVGYGGNRRPWH